MTTNASTFEGITVGLGQGDGASVAPGSDTFDLILEVESFDGPGGETPIIDVTHNGSSAKEKLVGLPDEGQFTVTGNLVVGDTGQDAARAARASRTLKNVQVTLNDYAATGSVLDFKAFVTGFKINGAKEDKISVSMTFEISGPVTYTTGSDV